MRGARVLAATGLLATVSVSASGAGSLGGANWPNVPYHSIDPQIAAGPSHVLVTQYDQVYYYDKSGQPITHVANDAGKPLLVTSLEALFDPIRDDADTHLRLPDGYTCNLSFQDQETYQVHQDGNLRTVRNYCLTRFGYDARVLYDEYRERFVIVAVAFNPSAKCAYNPVANYKARRTKVLVAYSASSDPTDGRPWHVMWFDAVPGESCDTQACREAWNWKAGSAADYPVAAVTRNHLLVSISNQKHEKVTSCSDDPDHNDDFDDLTSTVHVWDTRALSTGKYDQATCNGICSWVYYGSDLKHQDGAQVTGTVTVGRAHGDPYLNDGWFAQRDGASKLTLWHFPLGGTAAKPPLHRKVVTVPALDDTSAGDNSYGNAGHAPLSINGTTSLVQRGPRLYYADVGGMRHGSALDASIRLFVLRGDESGSAFTVGRDTILHQAGLGYGSPALEVNSKDDITMTYRKVGDGSGDGNGARFLVWPSGSSEAPEGQALARDKATLACGSPCEKKGDFDTAGISLAPQGRVYVMQPFIEADRRWGYAINYVVP